MAALVTQNLVNAGTVPTPVAASAADTAEVGSGTNTFLVLANTNAAPRTVTIEVTGETDYGVPRPDATYTLAATTGEAWIPLRSAYIVENGRANITITPAAADVTVAVVRVG